MLKIFLRRFVLCRRAKIQRVATLYTLHVPPRQWHSVGLDYLTRLHVSKDLDNVLNVVDHLTRMARFLPCTRSVTTKEIAIFFYMESTDYMDYPQCSSLIVTRNASMACGRHFGDAVERDSTCVLINTQKQMD
jgi:hypothetical protein